MSTRRPRSSARSGRLAGATESPRVGAAGRGERGPREGVATRDEPFTYIQRGTTIVGELEARGRVRVHGVVRGEVKVDGPLEVAESGVVEGVTIEADEVKIIGRVVVEQLLVRGKVEIWKGGELIGDVRAAALDIEEGARFTGRSEMITEHKARLPDALTVGADELEPTADVLLLPSDVETSSQG